MITQSERDGTITFVIMTPYRFNTVEDHIKYRYHQNNENHELLVLTGGDEKTNN
jgi:homogentisate 1,2-dioxygenase